MSSVEGFVLEQHNSGVITVSNSNFSLAPLCNFKVFGDREDQYFHIAQLNGLLFMWGLESIFMFPDLFRVWLDIWLQTVLHIMYFNMFILSQLLEEDAV